MRNDNLRPLVGIGVLIKQGKKILLLKRSQKVSHGRGEWALPGGHLEFGETLEEAAFREVKEETGLKIGQLKFFCVFNARDYLVEDKKHILCLCFIADYQGGMAKNLEPEKCEEIGWFGLNNLPNPLFKHTKKAIVCYKEGKSYLSENFGG